MRTRMHASLKIGGLTAGLLARPTVHRLTKCGWVPYADLRQRSLEMKWNEESMDGG